MKASRLPGLFAAATCAAFAFLSTGCASLIHGTNQEVPVVTAPEGATVSAAGQTIRSPGVLVLPRKSQSVEVRIEKDGFVPRVVRLERTTSAAVWLTRRSRTPSIGSLAGALCTPTRWSLREYAPAT